MFILIAEASRPHFSGEISRQVFADLPAAVAEMARWAKFGVDGYCNEADEIWVVDARQVAVRRWNWRLRRPDTVEIDVSATG